MSSVSLIHFFTHFTVLHYHIKHLDADLWRGDVDKAHYQTDSQPRLDVWPSLCRGWFSRKKKIGLCPRFVKRWHPCKEANCTPVINSVILIQSVAADIYYWSIICIFWIAKPIWNLTNPNITAFLIQHHHIAVQCINSVMENVFFQSAAQHFL